jgi:putative transposase
MPWNETTPMNERVKFIARYPQNEEPFSELCAYAGVSRKTGYTWVERYDAGGVAALVDQSRAPRPHPHAVSSAVIERMVATRRRIRGGARAGAGAADGVAPPPDRQEVRVLSWREVR